MKAPITKIVLKSHGRVFITNQKQMNNRFTNSQSKVTSTRVRGQALMPRSQQFNSLEPSL